MVAFHPSNMQWELGPEKRETTEQRQVLTFFVCVERRARRKGVKGRESSFSCQSHPPSPFLRSNNKHNSITFSGNENQNLTTLHPNMQSRPWFRQGEMRGSRSSTQRFVSLKQNEGDADWYSAAQSRSRPVPSRHLSCPSNPIVLLISYWKSRAPLVNHLPPYNGPLRRVYFLFLPIHFHNSTQKTGYEMRSRCNRKSFWKKKKKGSGKSCCCHFG